MLIIEVLKEHGYTIEQELGRGASGIAFLVKDTDGDPYVVKQMNSRDVSIYQISLKYLTIGLT